MYLNNYISSFGTRLQTAREAVGMTQTQFAEKVIRRSGRSIDAGAYIKRISAWENGRIKGSNCPGSKINMPTINELAEFCDILDVDIDYLLGVQDKPRKEIADAATVTGLSYETIRVFQMFSRKKRSALIDQLILSHDFPFLLEQQELYRYVKRTESERRIASYALQDRMRMFASDKDQILYNSEDRDRRGIMGNDSVSLQRYKCEQLYQSILDEITSSKK